MVVVATTAGLVDGEELVDGKLVVSVEVDAREVVACDEAAEIGSSVVDSLEATFEVVTSSPSPQGG